MHVLIQQPVDNPLRWGALGAIGAGIDNTTFMGGITSYDYDTFISEAGGYDQPGVGGDGNKFQVRFILLSFDTDFPPPNLASKKGSIAGTPNCSASLSIVLCPSAL